MGEILQNLLVHCSLRLILYRTVLSTARSIPPLRRAAPRCLHLRPQPNHQPWLSRLHQRKCNRRPEVLPSTAGHRTAESLHQPPPTPTMAGSPGIRPHLALDNRTVLHPGPRPVCTSQPARTRRTTHRSGGTHRDSNMGRADCQVRVRRRQTALACPLARIPTTRSSAALDPFRTELDGVRFRARHGQPRPSGPRAEAEGM